LNSRFGVKKKKIFTVIKFHKVVLLLSEAKQEGKQ